MKRLISITLLLLLMISGGIEAADVDIAVTDSVTFTIPELLDTLGFPIPPDSLQLYVTHSSTKAVFQASNTTYPFVGATWCDTLNRNGKVQILIRAQFDAINGSATTGQYTVTAIPWFTQGARTVPQSKSWIVQVFATSPYYLNNSANLASVSDFFNEPQAAYTTPNTFGYFLDAQISTLGGSGVFSTQDRDSVMNAITDAAMGDKMWLDYMNRTLSAFGFNVTLADGSLTSAKIAANAFAAASFAAGALNGKGDWATSSALSSHDATLVAYNSVFDLMRDSLSAIVDTLKNQDNWVAKETSVGGAQTDVSSALSLLGIIRDSLQSQDNWVAKQAFVQELLDSLQNYDNWIAKEASVQAIRDTLPNISGGSGVWTVQDRDSVLNAILDANKGNFMADVSPLALASDLQAAIDSLGRVLDSLGLVRSDIAAVPTAVENGEQAYISLSSGTREQTFWADISSLATVTSITTVQAALDTLGVRLTLTPGSSAYTYRHADVDSLVLKKSGARYGKLEFWHPGGSAGDPPDTSKGVQ